MRSDFPYKTQPCSHCLNRGKFCDWCLGTGREVKRISEERDYFSFWLVLIVALMVLAMIGASR